VDDYNVDLYEMLRSLRSSVTLADQFSTEANEVLKEVDFEERGPTQVFIEIIERWAQAHQFGFNREELEKALKKIGNSVFIDNKKSEYQAFFRSDSGDSFSMTLTGKQLHDDYSVVDIFKKDEHGQWQWAVPSNVDDLFGGVGDLYEVLRFFHSSVTLAGQFNTEANEVLREVDFDEEAKELNLDDDFTGIVSSSPIVGPRKEIIDAMAGDEVGGIDLNAIEVDRQGAGIEIQFDPVEIQQIIDLGVAGFTPVIISIIPLPSILPLLGLAPARKEEFELSSLN